MIIKKRVAFLDNCVYNWVLWLSLLQICETGRGQKSVISHFKDYLLKFIKGFSFHSFFLCLPAACLREYHMWHWLWGFLEWCNFVELKLRMFDFFSGKELHHIIMKIYFDKDSCLLSTTWLILARKLNLCFLGFTIIVMVV